MDDGLTCGHCHEPIRAGESAEVLMPLHIECAARLAIGSLAHVLRRCSCYIPGATEGDPPGVSKRNAARAAFAVHRIASQYYPPEVPRRDS